MIGILFIYLIGRSYYQLAKAYGKSKVGFAILGVTTYYGGTFLFGIALGVTLELLSPGTLERMSDFAAGLIAVPFGLLATGVLYYVLRRIWKAQHNDATQLMNPKQS